MLMIAGTGYDLFVFQNQSKIKKIAEVSENNNGNILNVIACMKGKTYGF